MADEQTSMTPAESPVPDSGAAGFVGTDGAFQDGWLDRIGPDLASNKTIQGAKNIQDLASQVVNLEKVLGSKRATIPSGPDDKEHLDKYFRHVGWPNSPDAYPEIKAALPEGMHEDPELTKTWRQWAHEARLTPAQMQYLTEKTIAWNINAHKQMNEQRAGDLSKAKADLQSRWQAKYQTNVQMANTAAAAFADENELNYFRDAGLLEDPRFLSFMQKVGEAISPDRLHARSDGRPDVGSIQRQINDLMADEKRLRGTEAQRDAINAQIMQLREQLSAAG